MGGWVGGTLTFFRLVLLSCRREFGRALIEAEEEGEKVFILYGEGGWVGGWVRNLWVGGWVFSL